MTQKEVFLNAYHQRNDVEDGIKALKALGVSQFETVRIVVECLGVPLKDADRIVLNSNSWKENKQKIEDIRNDIGDFLTRLPE